mgnify:FL=1
MSISRLSNNKFKIIIELGYDILGNRKRKIERFSGTKNEAVIREAELKKQYYHIGNVSNISDLTFEEFSQIFMAKYCANIGLITKDGYEKSLKRILPIIGKIKLNKITPLILDNLYLKLKIGEKGQELGYHSMYSFYKLINVMLNQAIKWELLDKNPNLKANKPKREKKERNYYDLEQAQKLITCLEKENIKYRALITLALDSGARRSEICALRWTDIDFKTNTIKITKSLKVVKGVVDEATTKTDSSKREIIISNTTMKILKEYKEWQDSIIAKKGKSWNNENRVFTSKDGNYIYPTTCDHTIKKIVKKYNLAPISFHELRHTSASILIYKGINPKAVSERLGHASTDITMEIYSHVFDVTKKASANIFDEVLSFS